VGNADAKRLKKTLIALIFFLSYQRKSASSALSAFLFYVVTFLADPSQDEKQTSLMSAVLLAQAQPPFSLTLDPG